MALTSKKTKQPYLDNLDLPSKGLKSNDAVFPSRSEIDPERVEYFVDVDLDQLSVFFGDKSRPYSHDESDATYSLLIDEETDQVIGISINRFLSHAIKVHPELIPVLRHATVAAGKSLEDAHLPDAEDRHGLRSRIQEWVSDRVRAEERKAIFTDFANLVGIP